MQALLAEMRYYAKTVKKQKLTSIFFGGGTPSLMTPQEVSTLIEQSEKLFGHEKDIEISLEANPTSSSKTHLRELSQAGINRFSIGVQSLQPDHLAFLGREHNTDDALKTIESALSSGARSVNVDFIFGLPNQSLNQWVEDLNTICQLGTQHISAYQLTIEPHTKFYTQVKRGLWTPLDDDRQADFITSTRATLEKHNFKQYEVSNFAKNGYQCKHNSKIWQYNSYIGIGAGAHGRTLTHENKQLSTQNHKKISTYINKVKLVEHGAVAIHEINEADQFTEKLLSALRTVEGCPLTSLERGRLNTQALKTLIQEGMVHNHNGWIRLSPSGLLHADSIIEKILF